MNLPLEILKRVLLFTGLFLYLSISCIPPNHEPPPNPFLTDLKDDTDIGETGQALPYFTTYVETMSDLGLSSIFKQKGPYTLFIPRQEAFARYLKDNDLKSLHELPEDQLKALLLNHIILGKWMTFDLKSGYYQTQALESTTGNPIDLYINRSSVLMINGKAAFGTSDIESDNGIIHSMTSVIELPDLYTHLSTNPEFSYMLKLIGKKGMKTDYLKLLKEGGPITLFVPDNQAFESFFKSNPYYHSVADIPPDLAERILNNHLILNTNAVLRTQSGNLRLSDQFAKTIEIRNDGKSISIHNDDQEIKIINPDLQAVNGIIHEIDQIILYK